MQVNYKPAIEIAEEEAIDTLLRSQIIIKILRKRCDYDQMVLGVSMAKHEFLTGSRG